MLKRHNSAKKKHQNNNKNFHHFKRFVFCKIAEFSTKPISYLTSWRKWNKKMFVKKARQYVLPSVKGGENSRISRRTFLLHYFTILLMGVIPMKISYNVNVKYKRLAQYIMYPEVERKKKVKCYIHTVIQADTTIHRISIRWLKRGE